MNSKMPQPMPASYNDPSPDFLSDKTKNPLPRGAALLNNRYIPIYQKITHKTKMMRVSGLRMDQVFN